MRTLRASEIPGGPDVQAALQMFFALLSPDAKRRVVRVILYGSVARGERRPGSDIDLLVVWRGSYGSALEELVRASTMVLIETGVDISVHPYTPEQFDEIARMRTGFYENVEREGILVG